MINKDRLTTTASAVREAADVLRSAAADLELVATRLEQSGDLGHVARAVAIIANVVPNCRLDLFVSRPLHEMQVATAISEVQEGGEA